MILCHCCLAYLFIIIPKKQANNKFDSRKIHKYFYEHQVMFSKFPKIMANSSQKMDKYILIYLLSLAKVKALPRGKPHNALFS